MKKKTARQKAKQFREELTGIDWEFSFTSTGFNIGGGDQDHSYDVITRSIVEYNKDDTVSINAVRLVFYVTLKPIEYFLESYGLAGDTYNITSEKETPILKDNTYRGKDSYNYWEELFPIWKRHYYEQIIPRIQQLDDLEYLHDYNEERNGYFLRGYTRHTFLKKLIDHPSYDEYIEWVIGKRNEYIETHEDERDKVIAGIKLYQQLISDLQTFDADEYLRTKPWREQSPPPAAPAQRFKIGTDQLVLLAIDQKLDVEQIATLLSTPLTKEGQETAGEAANISHGDDIHVLYNSKTTLIFLDAVDALSRINWSAISPDHQAIGLLRLETATNAYELEYWSGGEQQLRRQEIDGMRLEDTGQQQAKYDPQNTEEAINTIFKTVTGRGLDTIYEDEKAVRYGMG